MMCLVGSGFFKYLPMHLQTRQLLRAKSTFLERVTQLSTSVHSSTQAAAGQCPWARHQHHPQHRSSRGPLFITEAYQSPTSIGSSPPSQTQHRTWEGCREIEQRVQLVPSINTWHHLDPFPRPEYLTSGQPPNLTAPPLYLLSNPSSRLSHVHRPSSGSYYFSSTSLKSFFSDLSSST